MTDQASLAPAEIPLLILQTASQVPVLPGAACAEEEDPRIFFPRHRGEANKAKTVCARCPVRAACLAGAEAREEESGIWGGRNFGSRLIAPAGTPEPRNGEHQVMTSMPLAGPDTTPGSTPAAGRTPAGTGPGAGGRSSALISRVHPHPGNIRTEIGDLEETAASIRAHGILQPLTVEPMPGKPGHWQVIAGHRRLAAAKVAGLQAVPITVREPDGSEPEELMLIENCHRRDLSLMDKAEAMGALRSKGYSVARIARSTGFAEGTVYSYMALLDLAPRTREMVRDGRLSAADALAGVRRARKRQRKQTGKPSAGPLWEPDHFTGQHQLARKARALCDAREHSMRRRVGRIACGQCWETVIREDERTVAAALAGSGAVAAGGGA
jgi:ParB family chromosome partitioning protein